MNKNNGVTVTLPDNGMCALVKKIDGRYEIDTGRIKGKDIFLSPWVKTSDRLPDKCNRYNMYLTIKKRGGGVWQVSGNFIKEHPELCPYWMPIPPLPEVEE